MGAIENAPINFELDPQFAYVNVSELPDPDNIQVQSPSASY